MDWALPGQAHSKRSAGDNQGAGKIRPTDTDWGRWVAPTLPFNHRMWPDVAWVKSPMVRGVRSGDEPAEMAVSGRAVSFGAGLNAGLFLHPCSGVGHRDRTSG